MNETLKKLEAELRENTSQYRNNIETIFNIGVKFGKELQASNIQEYRLDYFIEIEELDNLSESIRKTIDDITDLIFTQVKEALKEFIEEEGSWSVGVGSYYRNDGTLTDEIVNKHYVQFEKLEQPQTDGDFEARFRIKGKLADVFSEHGYNNSIEITLENSSGDDNTTLYKEADLKKLYSPSLMINPRKNKEELEKLKVFKEALVKKLMFQIIGRT